MAYFNINEQKQYREIPSTYKNSLGYNYADFSVHYADGFRGIIEPVFNPDTERKGSELILVVETPYDYFTYGVIPYTPEEIVVIVETKEENTDKDEYTNLIQNGNDLFLRHQARLIRRVKRGSLTQARAKTVRTLLIETYNLMTIGLIELALDRANAIPVQNNNGIQNEIVWMQEKLTELMTDYNPLRML
jgi:hypothetical protein